MVGIMLRCMDGFLLSVLEGRELGSFLDILMGLKMSWVVLVKVFE